MHIVIIGNGISGISCARWIRKLSDHKVTVISSESAHFFSRTALMYIYMGHMRFSDTKPYEDHFWGKNQIELLQAHVNAVDFRTKSLFLKSGETMIYDKLVLALGSRSNKFGWPGQDLSGVSGLYSLQDLEQIETYSEGLERAVIVGGGLIGIELAEMFHSRHIPVTMLVREDSFWDVVLPIEESKMISRHIVENGIDLRLQTNLEKIIDDGNGKACAVITKETGDRIECGFVGLTAGVSPNIDFLRDSDLNINKGIKIDNHLVTNIPDVYAIGDCAELTDPQPGRREIEAVWYTGRMMGETCAHNICGNSIKYDPGIWYNSAKFLDIEYQVYGEILPSPQEHHQSLYWEHPDGTRSVRINYDNTDMSVVGFNLMGIRFRQEICQKWILKKTSIIDVMTNLSMAYFDPEFYRTYETEISESFSQQTGITFKTSSPTSLNRVISFIKA